MSNWRKTLASLQPDQIPDLKSAAFVEIQIDSSKENLTGKAVPVSTTMKYRTSSKGKWNYVHDCDSGEQDGLATYIPESVEEVLLNFGLSNSSRKEASTGKNPTRTYIISGDETDMDNFEKLMTFIEHLINVGASRSIKVSVDGDGSASIRFKRTDGVEMSDLDKSEWDELKSRDLDDFSIGIGE